MEYTEASHFDFTCEDTMKENNTFADESRCTTHVPIVLFESVIRQHQITLCTTYNEHSLFLSSFVEKGHVTRSLGATDKTTHYVLMVCVYTITRREWRKPSQVVVTCTFVEGRLEYARCDYRAVSERQPD